MTAGGGKGPRALRLPTNTTAVVALIAWSVLLARYLRTRVALSDAHSPDFSVSMSTSLKVSSDMFLRRSSQRQVIMLLS